MEWLIILALVFVLGTAVLIVVEGKLAKRAAYVVLGAAYPPEADVRAAIKRLSRVAIGQDPERDSLISRLQNRLVPPDRFAPRDTGVPGTPDERDTTTT